MNNTLAHKDIIDLIKRDFSKNEVEQVLAELSTVTLKHVMAESEFNLHNTYVAILKLSKGNLSELIRLVECAKRDFRDVIYWATME